MYPLTPEEFKDIYSRVPRLCVDLIIQSDKGVLLMKRTLASWHGQWYLPGGTVLYKETIEQTAKRIAQHEVGLEIQIEKFLGYIEFTSEEKERGFGWAVSLALLCSVMSGTPKESDQGASPTFFTQLPENVIKEQKEFLQMHLGMK